MPGSARCHGSHLPQLPDRPAGGVHLGQGAAVRVEGEDGGAPEHQAVRLVADVGDAQRFLARGQVQLRAGRQQPGMRYTGQAGRQGR